MDVVAVHRAIELVKSDRRQPNIQTAIVLPTLPAASLSKPKRFEEIVSPAEMQQRICLGIGDYLKRWQKELEARDQQDVETIESWPVLVTPEDLQNKDRSARLADLSLALMEEGHVPLVFENPALVRPGEGFQAGQLAVKFAAILEKRSGFGQADIVTFGQPETQPVLATAA